jgi:hypothetical protein
VVDWHFGMYVLLVPVLQVPKALVMVIVGNRVYLVRDHGSERKGAGFTYPQCSGNSGHFASAFYH